MAESKLYTDPEDAGKHGPLELMVQGLPGSKKFARIILWLDDMWRMTRFALSSVEDEPAPIVCQRIKEAVVSLCVEFALCRSIALRQKEYLYWTKLRPALVALIQDSSTTQ